MGSDAAWSLTEKERNETVERVAASIASLAFFHNTQVSAEDAHRAAVAIERKAYTAAQVAARTTTGTRPASETTSSYARKLGELALEVVKAGGKLEQGAAGQQAGTAEELDLTGSRDFLTSESAKEVLAVMLAEGSKVKKVKFSSKSFGRDAAHVAATAIENIAATLEHADISDIIAGRPEDEALDVLRIVSKGLTKAKLKALNISDNALGEKGVRACADVITGQTSLEELSLQNVGCSIFACKAVEELTAACSSLRLLHLFNNMSDNAGAQHIAAILARSPNMQDFRMASSRVGPQGGIALAKGLSMSQSLIKLDISDNPMTAEIAGALAACLKQQRKLRHLNLNDTSLTDEGITTICTALVGAAPELEELELALNEITPASAAAVAAAVHGKSKLLRLNLRENELEDKGAATVVKGLAGNTTLQVLDLCCNQIKRAGALAAARAVADKPALQLLALDENEISEAGVDTVREVLTEAFGSDKALGPMDDNDADGEDDEEDEEEEEGGVDELAAALAKAGL